MDYKNAYMRSLRDVTRGAKPAHMECRINGDVACGRKVEVPRQPVADSVQGFKWFPKNLVPVDLAKPWDADFPAYATRWEKRYSVLVPDKTDYREFVPIVDYRELKLSGTFTVVGHYGIVPQNNVIVLKKYAVGAPGAADRDSHRQMQWIMEQGITAYVEQDYPDAGDWGSLSPYSSGYPVSFVVVTDVEGKILANLGAVGSERGLVSVDVLDYIMVGELLVDLAKLGSKMIVAMARKSAQKAIQTEVTSLAKRKLTKEVEGDLETAAAEQIAVKLAQRSTEYARKSGIAPKHFKAFQEAARETNLIAVVRNGNEVAIPLIEKGCPGKPKIFEPFNTSPSTGILTATTAADKELVLKNKYLLVSDSRVAVRRLPTGAMERMELKDAFWQLEPGQVIDPALKKPVVGDYDLMGVFSPANPGQNITLHSVGGEKLKNMTSPLVDQLSAKVNGKFDMPRVLHGAQDQYAGFRKGATAFFPDGTVVYMETEQEVKALYDSVGRQTIKGSYPRPGPGVTVPADELAARRGQ